MITLTSRLKGLPKSYLIGLIRYRDGETVGVSTGIHEGLTFGYGQLDINGYWEFPVPTFFLNPKHKKLLEDHNED